jgi:hypothetical protein
MIVVGYHGHGLRLWRNSHHPQSRKEYLLLLFLKNFHSSPILGEPMKKVPLEISLGFYVDKGSLILKNSKEYEGIFSQVVM